MTKLPPTYEEENAHNKEQFLEVLKACDPELYMIKISLDESQVNPRIIPKIIRTIGNLTIGTGYGKIQIFMQARVITQIKPEENVDVNESAVILEERKIIEKILP